MIKAALDRQKHVISLLALSDMTTVEILEKFKELKLEQGINLQRIRYCVSTLPQGTHIVGWERYKEWRGFFYTTRYRPIHRLGKGENVPLDVDTAREAKSDMAEEVDLLPVRRTDAAIDTKIDPFALPREFFMREERVAA
jgi:hypothetical protein